MSAGSAAGAGSAVSPARARWNRLFQGLQKMGRSLQLPIAVLPAAGVLNRLGQPDVFGDEGLGWTNVSGVMTGAGGALPDGTVVHGDINMFLAGDPTAGQFTTGFFPVMMFASPAAALAITHCAKPHRRKEVGGLMLSVGLTSFVTGITEPLEYSFLFVAPALYVVHPVLTGVSMAVTWGLGVKDGFSFSAGPIDYVINWNPATRPWLIVPVGLCFAAVYYVVFRFAITRFGLRTPGREPEEEMEDAAKE
ncbi:PTS transporter subunit EIIC [Streptomyces pimonensis]|uniref:PTS transporter subunit EIIC n=1 Tax=Streptomyces pimonensis TaxID=2860288 RepID=A0ABV4IXS6_9ACTN